MADHVCPWWLGYLLASPLRRILESPEKMIGPHVAPGMTVLDFGCAMGFFSLPAAELTGKNGKVVCVDLQERMLTTLRKRARKAGLADRIDARVCAANACGMADLRDKIDFAMAIHVLHEVPNVPGTLTEIFATLRAGAKLFVAEPSGHVSEADFDRTINHAKQAGFVELERPFHQRGLAVLLQKPAF